MDCYIAKRQKGYPLLTIISDSFNRSDGNLGNADTGQAWLTKGSATTKWVVGSNRAKRASSTTAIGDVAYIDCGKPNVLISADIAMTTASGADAHLIARMSGTSIENCIHAAFYLSPGFVRIVKRISGSYTNLASVSYSFTSGVAYSCELRCIGNDFTVLINGVIVATATDDNALKTNTLVGMYMPILGPVANDYFDNFLVKG